MADGGRDIVGGAGGRGGGGGFVRALAELGDDAGGTAPCAKPGMPEVLAVLEALDAELMHVSSTACDSGKNNNGHRQGREPSGLWMAPP